MPQLTLGWVQDAGSLANLRCITALLSNQRVLPRAEFLQQIRSTINVGRWADDNYARFAHALGFASYDRRTNTFAITDRGQTLINTNPNSLQEKMIFGEALLSNPPVVRVLQLLESGQPLTKFEIGAKLGFGWERGFTTYPQSALLIELSQVNTSREKNKIFSNREGTSDKYARMICSWLQNIGWIAREVKQISISIGGVTYRHEISQSYRITPAGLDALRRARGINIRRRITKIVPAEMLCSGSHPNYDFIRQRRIAILRILQDSRPHTLTDIVARLGQSGINADNSTVQLDLQGLINCGFNIMNGRPSYTLRDTLSIEIPPLIARPRVTPNDIDEVVREVATSCQAIPREFLNIIPFSFDGRSSRFFEMRTYELCKDLMNFDAELLGGSGEPDVIAWYINEVPHPYGLIIDCKSRARGYTIPIGDQRQMRDYIREFTPYLLERGAQEVYFLFATSILRGEFTSSLRDIYGLTNARGSAISSGAMLHLADRILTGHFSLAQIRPLFQCLDEINRERIDNVLS